MASHVFETKVRVWLQQDERAIENLPRGQQPKEETQLPGQAAKSVPEKPLSRMRKAELQDECRLLGVPDQGTVPEMRARLRAARRVGSVLHPAFCIRFRVRVSPA